MEVEPQSITREEFLQFPVPRSKFFANSEREWYKLGDILGVVILDPVDKDWSHVVLGVKEGKYTAIDFGTDESSAEDARRVLFQKMRLKHLN